MHGGFSGAAVQLKPMTLEEDAVAVRLAGPVGGTALHVDVAEVSALACAEAADVPSTSSAFTT